MKKSELKDDNKFCEKCSYKNPQEAQIATEKKPIEKIKILFVPYPSSSFIKNDFKILQKHFNVTPIQWRGKRDILNIVFGVLKSDVVFSWFAMDHAAIAIFFSKLFRKKSIVIVGGVDVAKVPEINYGQFTLGWHKRMITKFALKHAAIVLPVSKFTKNEVLEKVTPKQLKLVYNGVDIEKFKPSPEKKEKIVVTIGRATKQHYKLKGIVPFAKASVHFPDYRFVIIGSTDPFTVTKLKKINPKLIFTGQINHEKVLKWLQCAKIYCQLSYRESFGLGLAEAMSCNCIPIVTDRGALSEVVGDAGFYIPYDNEKATVESIKKALQTSDKLGKEARGRIIKIFSLQKREKRLVKIVDMMTDAS